MTRNTRLFAAQSALLEGDTSRAERLYQDILQDQSDSLEALDGLGILYCQRGETARGIDYFQDALRLVAEGADVTADSSEDEKQRHLEAQATLLFHLGLAQRSAGQRDEAIQSLRWSLQLVSTTGEALLNLGQLLFELQQYAEAVDAFRTLTDLEPDNASVWLTLGYIQTLSGDYDGGIQSLESALGLDPASPDACFHLAETFRKTERYEKSLPYYQRMLQVAAEWPQAIQGYGKSLLALGRLADGWDAMEFRLACSFGTWERHLLPNWEGDGSNEETVLAYSEESIAADLMFASCLPDLINSVDHCVIECDRSLHSLFRRSFPRATVVGSSADTVGEMTIEPATSANPTGVVHPEGGRAHNPWGLSLDRQIALGSLPRYFRKEHGDFPLRKAYLVPDRGRVESWTNKLSEIGGIAKVGVLWQGSWTAETERQTALPLPELRNLMLRHQADAAWICLQHGSKQKEIDLYRRNVSLQLHLFREIFQYDLDEMAAMATALDLIVTPPGYVAHLAGALGVQTWVVLPERSDWRWNLGRNESLWHPSMRVYRQKTGQAWPELFEEIENDLEIFLATYRPPEEETPVTLAFPGAGRQDGTALPKTLPLKIRRAA